MGLSTVTLVSEYGGRDSREISSMKTNLPTISRLVISLKLMFYSVFDKLIFPYFSRMLSMDSMAKELDL